MASLRKKPEDTPVDTIAETPQPASETPKPAESNPADVAAAPSPVDEAAQQSFLKARIAEMEGAERINREQIEQARAAHAPQQPEEEQEQHEPPSEEQVEQAIADWNVPEKVKGWFRRNPSWATDPNAQAQLAQIHRIAAQATGAAEFRSHA